MYTVLVCDDDRAILDSIRIYLTQEGYEVLTAMDGIEALELLKEHEVHCMVHGQDHGAQLRRGRLRHETLQPAGTGGPGEVPGPPVREARQHGSQ